MCLERVVCRPKSMIPMPVRAADFFAIPNGSARQLMSGEVRNLYATKTECVNQSHRFDRNGSSISQPLFSLGLFARNGSLGHQFLIFTSSESEEPLNLFINRRKLC